MEANYLKRLLIALGGNALVREGQQGTLAEMQQNLAQACRALAPLLASWYQVVITYGNGPQVGAIMLQNEQAREEVPPMPLDVCGAQSQGMLGFLIQQALEREMGRLGKPGEVAALLTQTLVDAEDSAFADSNKPVGPWYSAPEPPQDGRAYKRFQNKGWRRVVSSPRPREVLGRETIDRLLEAGVVVVAGGGGGVPVVRDPEKGLCGVEAVVDKDLASQVLASAVGAHILLILTDVPAVFLDFGGKDQCPLSHIEAPEMRRLWEKGLFPAGSIGPKVEAAIRFVEQGGRKAVIAAMQSAALALKGECGTTVLPAKKGSRRLWDFPSRDGGRDGGLSSPFGKRA